MALRWRVTDIPENDENGVPYWKQGLVKVVYEVYDDAAPQVVLHPGNRQFTTETTEQMIAAINAEISRLKAAFDKRAALVSGGAIGSTHPVA